MAKNKLFHFLTLTDPEELHECSSYDHNLVYASLIRQIISFLFSFSVFVYGAIMFLPYTQAIVISLLISCTLFTIDQAIIGSEWSLQFDFFRTPLVNKIANVVLLPIRLFPRIIFSVSIAYFIATIAEISIQHKAIDEVLQKESLELNNEYFSKIKQKENSLNGAIITQEKDINDLSDRIKNKKSLLASFNLDMSSDDEDTISENLKISVANLDSKKKITSENSNKIKLLKAKLLKKQGLLDTWEKEKYFELTPERGAQKGDRWRRANQKTILLGQDIGEIKAEINELESFNDIYLEQLESGIKNTNQLITYKNSIGDEKLNELEEKLREESINYSENKKIAKEELLNYKKQLKDDGLFFELKNGPLGRYIGLNKLYEDPKYGQAAKEFSYGLKLVVILIELSPVLVMVFFSPYSFYAERMRNKKHLMENSIPTNKLKSDIEESQKQRSMLEEEKKEKQKRKFNEQLDKNLEEYYKVKK